MERWNATVYWHMGLPTYYMTGFIPAVTTM